MAALPTRSYPHISVEPQVMSGRPCIAGTRVRVMDIVAALVGDEELGRQAERERVQPSR